MIGYVLVGTADLPRACGFYDEIAALMGVGRMMEMDRAVIWGTGFPALGATLPYDGAPATVGNGTMVALAAANRAAVDALHAKALSLGGADEGAPGIRGTEEGGFYAAYFRDLDGNKLCAYCIGPA